MDYGVLQLYTWHDVERRLLHSRKEWPSQWVKADVFSTEIVIYAEDVTDKVQETTKAFFKELFKQYYRLDTNAIEIPVTQTGMQICLEKTEKGGAVKPFPLFKDFTYITAESDVELPDLAPLEIPVIAFHSYKGGVGRTLSLIAFVREMISLYGKKKKVLIVDGDMEAPGLTWLGAEHNHYAISYLDVLGIIGAKGNQSDIIEEISSLVGRSSLVFQTGDMEISQYFLPTYREEGQMLDVYSNPERIMMGEKNKYIIVDTLVRIGKCLHVEAVLVDLRTGFSEYSSPFLFDPRVDKLLVSSTSLQSVMGTNMILKELKKQKGNEAAIKKILLTMVDKRVFKGGERDHIYRLLLQEQGAEADCDMAASLQQLDSVEELEYNASLIHLGDLRQICDSLNYAAKTTAPLKELAQKLLSDKDVGKGDYKKGQIEQFRQVLHDICEKSITAEGGDISNMLATRAVLQLGDFVRDVPRVNIMGAKGSGKTYLYTQMLKVRTWENFLAQIGCAARQNVDTLLCPVLCSEDRAGISDILSKSRAHCIDGIPQMSIGTDYLTRNGNKLREAIKNGLIEGEWQEFWQSLILDMFGGLSSWEELQSLLNKQNKRFVFLFDGIETIFRNFEKDDSERCGIRTLCRGMINQLNELQVSNVGIIVFLRKDIAELSIGTNFEQFRSQYVQYELNWTQKDALQLALKLAERAGSLSGIQWRESRIPVEDASRNVIEEELAGIWGTKMGADSSKQAYTVRWVLASLADFNGQLQARDIVRFLSYASKYELNDKTILYDRFLMPTDMKQAIRECSDKKFSEVEKEIHQLKSSFQKLQEVEKKDKQVPLLDKVLDILDSEEKKNMERFGYLKEADGEYYISESIRYALGYDKTRWGGIKLVSLLVDR